MKTAVTDSLPSALNVHVGDGEPFPCFFCILGFRALGRAGTGVTTENGTISSGGSQCQLCAFGERCGASPWTIDARRVADDRTLASARFDDCELRVAGDGAGA